MYSTENPFGLVNGVDDDDDNEGYEFSINQRLPLRPADVICSVVTLMLPRRYPASFISFSFFLLLVPPLLNFPPFFLKMKLPMAP